jgi:glucose-6-phosphate 1-dehydrogenase
MAAEPHWMHKNGSKIKNNAHMNTNSLRNIKILVLGITGDLARKKILPAIGQFARRQSAEVELIGYSRSLPDQDDIRSSLGVSIPTSFLQGQYEDVAYYHSIISQLKADEQLIVYLAVPPHVFIPFLKNSCPFHDRPIDIIIEKPFGQSAQEAEQMIAIIAACDLHQRVHFFDHYLYKSAAILDDSLVRLLSAHTKHQTLASIQVQALEDIGVKGRGGYYDHTGAIKDMMPHLFSLIVLLCKQISCTIPWDNLQITDLKTEQYPGYLADVELDDSTTETYFCVQGSIDNLSLTLESGKMKPKKLTQITAQFVSGDSVVWQIAPVSQIIFGHKAGQSVVRDIQDDGVLDHTRAFESIVAEDFSRFVSPDEVKQGWEIAERVGQAHTYEIVES